MLLKLKYIKLIMVFIVTHIKLYKFYIFNTVTNVNIMFKSQDLTFMYINFINKNNLKDKVEQVK